MNGTGICTIEKYLASCRKPNCLVKYYRKKTDHVPIKLYLLVFHIFFLAYAIDFDSEISGRFVYFEY